MRDFSSERVSNSNRHRIHTLVALLFPIGFHTKHFDSRLQNISKSFLHTFRFPSGSRRQRRPEQRYPSKTSRDLALKPSFDATNVYQQFSHSTTHQGRRLVIASQASESRRLRDPSIGFSVSKVWKFHGNFCEDCCDDGTLERSLLHQTSSSPKLFWSEPFFQCVLHLWGPNASWSNKSKWHRFGATLKCIQQQTWSRRLFKDVEKTVYMLACSLVGEGQTSDTNTKQLPWRGSHHSYASTRSWRLPQLVVDRWCQWGVRHDAHGSYVDVAWW